MNLLGSFLIALSMYSKIPVPQVEWTKERMKYAMCFFPLIGLITGAVLVVAAQIGDGIDITGPAGGIYQLHHDDSSFPPRHGVGGLWYDIPYGGNNKR